MVKGQLPRRLIGKKDLTILFYGSIAALTIVSILALFTYSFLGAISPLNLIHYDDIRFSFTGTPTYTFLYSNNFNTGLSGINGTETNLTLGEGAWLTFHPIGDFRVTPKDDQTLTREGDRRQTYVGPGEEANVYVTISKSDNYNPNMHLDYNDSDNESVANSNENRNVTKIVRKSDDEYVLYANYAPGANVSFAVIDALRDPYTDEPRCNFPIRVTIDRCGEDGRPDRTGHLRSYEYNGTIDVKSGGGFSLKSPVKNVLPVYCQNATFKKAKGDLDVQHNGHESTPADTITAMRESGNVNKSIQASLLCGNIFATGDIDSLNFREKEFADPLVVIFKEGNFAILTGLLSSFLTIMLARLIANIKK